MPAHKDVSKIENDLHRILLTAAPVNLRGERTIVHLARRLGVSRSSVWKWIETGKLPPSRAVQIVDLSEGRVTLADLSRFVYNF